MRYAVYRSIRNSFCFLNSWRVIRRFFYYLVKVLIITDFGQRQKSALNAESTTDLPETLQVPSLCCYSFS